MEYVVVLVGKRALIARPVIGGKSFRSVAECSNETMAQTLVDELNASAPQAPFAQRTNSSQRKKAA